MLSTKTIETIKATVPVLEVYGTQITTVFYKNMFEAHPELLNIFNHANQRKGRQQAALANTVLAAAQNIDRLETIIPVVKQIAHKHRSLLVKPEHYPIVGEFLLKAIKEVLGDAATDEIINAWADAYGTIAQVFIDIEDQMYKESSTNGGWEGFKEFSIINKVQESEEITSFYLAPKDGSMVPEYEAGQYITVRLSMPGEDYLFNRQYSLSIAPNKEYLRISVKRERNVNTPEGKVSNYLHDYKMVGDVLEITAPAGEFTLVKDNNPAIFISGGVGITPFMSMIGKIKSENDTKKVIFVHSARNGAVQAFNNELSTFKEMLTNMELSYIYETPSAEDKLNPYLSKIGYIDGDWIKNNAIVPEANYYVCGPVPFLQAVIKGLKDNGINATNIHYEFFGPSMNL